MIEKHLPIFLWDGSQKLDAGFEGFTFEFDTDSGRMCATLAANEHASSLCNLVPAARKLASQFMCEFLKNLKADGFDIPCRKGCVHCCKYLISLSIPEIMCINRELAELTAENQRAVLDSLNSNAKLMLDNMPADILAGNSSLEELSLWYTELRLDCPFLDNNLCAIYASRPIACREHIVAGSDSACTVGNVELQDIKKPAISVAEALVTTTAELEAAEPEAVIMQLAPAWCELNAERCERKWPAKKIVQTFIKSLEAQVHQTVQLS